MEMTQTPKSTPERAHLVGMVRTTALLGVSRNVVWTAVGITLIAGGMTLPGAVLIAAAAANFAATQALSARRRNGERGKESPAQVGLLAVKALTYMPVIVLVAAVTIPDGGLQVALPFVGGFIVTIAYAVANVQMMTAAVAVAKAEGLA